MFVLGAIGAMVPWYNSEVIIVIGSSGGGGVCGTPWQRGVPCVATATLRFQGCHGVEVRRVPTKIATTPAVVSSGSGERERESIQQ